MPTRTTSLWQSDTPPLAYPPLAADVQADVCVVGAGISGLTTALLLQRAGRSVVVLDGGEAIGCGQTGRTTAHLASAVDDRYSDLENRFGLETARLVHESHAAAVDLIETLCREEAIDCQFQRVEGWLFEPDGDHGPVLTREFEAARRAGLDVRMAAQAPLTAATPDAAVSDATGPAARKVGPALVFANQAQFHPLRYLHGIARALEKHGGRIHTGSHAAVIEGGAHAHVVTSAGHTVHCGAIVVATNSPVNNTVALHTKQAAYRTFVIAAEAPQGTLPHALYWDTAAPYHYLRVAPGAAGKEWLVLGGEDHKTGQDDDGEARFAKLEQWLRAHVPGAGPVRHRWSGQVLEPADSLAFIGRNPLDKDNVYVVSGDSGNGLTHGTIAGLLLTDQMTLGDQAPLADAPRQGWAKVYDPGRSALAAAGTFLKEIANVVAQYSDLVSGGDVAGPDAIRPGQGAIVRRGLHKLAIYRDEAGTVHERSAVCVHLGCIVAWNSTEQSWDCPCHGSRFDPYGKVLCGPANRDLDPAA